MTLTPVPSQLFSLVKKDTGIVTRLCKSYRDSLASQASELPGASVSDLSPYPQYHNYLFLKRLYMNQAM